MKKKPSKSKRSTEHFIPCSQWELDIIEMSNAIWVQIISTTWHADDSFILSEVVPVTAIRRHIGGSRYDKRNWKSIRSC